MTLDPGENTTTLGVWRNPIFRTFAVANFINNVGEGVYSVALPLYVFKATGSLELMSIFAVLVPFTLLLSPMFGVLLDRYGTSKSYYLGISVQLLLTIAMNISVHLKVVWPFVIALASIVQVAASLYQNAWAAAIPVVFPLFPSKARTELRALYIVSRIVGPLIVALVAGRVSYLNLLWFNTVTCLAPLAWWFKESDKLQTVSRTTGVWFGQFRAGITTVRNSRRVMWTTALSLPIFLTASVSGTLTLAQFYLLSDLGLSPSLVSLVVVLTNVAAFVGARAVSRWHLRASLMTMSSLGAMVSALLLLMGLAKSSFLFISALALLMGVRSVSSLVSELVVYEGVPPEFIGRALGLIGFIDGLPVVIAPLIIPHLSLWLGPQTTLRILGGVTALLVATLSVGWWFKNAEL